jgi:polysaccharide pyruvyl transferase CsaB
MNLGDEAILESILAQLSTLSAELTVFSKNPQDTLRRHRVARSLAPRGLTRKEVRDEIAQLDLLVLGGGGILYDSDAAEYLREVFVAHEVGVPVLLYAISAGPLETDAARRAVRDALDASASTVVTVRDAYARRLLEDVGVAKDIHVTADPAFLLEPEPLPIEQLRAEGVDFDRPLIGFSVREPGPAAPDLEPDAYYALLSNAADYVIERYDADVLFVPMERTDVHHSHAVVSHMEYAERAEILRRGYSPRQILDLMGRFELAIGMRLHFLIFAALRGTPFTALPYASKVEGLLADLGLPSPPLSAINPGQLIARVDRAWDSRAVLREQILRRVPALRARAAATHGYLLELLGGSGAREGAAH